MSAGASRAPIPAGGVRWWLRAGEDPVALQRLLERALAARAGGSAQVLKRGRRKALFALTVDGRELLLKSNLRRGVGAALRGLRGGKARHELRVASALAARGLPAPPPLAAGEERLGPWLRADHLLVARLPGALDLAAHWRARLAPAERRALARELGALSRALHAAGLVQDDYAPNNFLVVPGGEPALHAIDFERARLERGPVSDAARLAMLAKLDRRTGSAASLADRMRFLRAYAVDAADARVWWARLHAHAPRLARQDVRRWHRTASVGARRFQRVEADGWRGVARSELELPALSGELGKLRSELPQGGVTAAAGCWIALRTDLDAGAAEHALAKALALWDGRGLAPRPLALLRSGRWSALVLERTPGARRCDAGAERAVGLLARRLAAIGRLAAPLAPDALACEVDARGHDRALLLDPSAWEPLRA